MYSNMVSRLSTALTLWPLADIARERKHQENISLFSLAGIRPLEREMQFFSLTGIGGSKCFSGCGKISAAML
jgi:hypothetical protein